MRQENFNNKAEEMKELMASKLPWFLRWGISIIFLILLLVFIMLGFIEIDNTTILQKIINSM